MTVDCGTTGWCWKCECPDCRAIQDKLRNPMPTATPAPGPDDRPSCPECGHAPHGKLCMNMGSDNDCYCTFQYPAAGADVTGVTLEVAAALKRWQRVAAGEWLSTVYSSRGIGRTPLQERDADAYILAVAFASSNIADLTARLDKYAALMVVPHPDGSETGASPESLRALLDELQGEWDNAERRISDLTARLAAVEKQRDNAGVDTIEARRIAAEAGNCDGVTTLEKLLSKMVVVLADSVDDLTTRLAAAEGERDKLAKFKAWVHDYLDASGVPHHPPGTHGSAGCRIGDRMDWLMERTYSF